MNVFLNGPYRVTQRSGWPLSYCVEHHPELIKPHIRKIILNLNAPGLHHATKRNTLRLLQFIEIPKSMLGIVADVSFRFLCDPKEPIAVKVFSMAILSKMSQHQPEIGRELKLIVEDQLPFAGPAFSSRARKVMQY